MYSLSTLTLSLLPFASFSLAQVPTATESAGASVISQIYGYSTTNLAALATQAPSAISALATTIPAASIIAMESQSSLLFKSQSTSSAPPANTAPPTVSEGGTSSSPTNTRNIILGAVLGFVLAFTLVCFVMYCVNVRRKGRRVVHGKVSRNPYLDIEQDAKPLNRSRSTKQLHFEDKAPAVVSEAYDDLHMLGADGAYNSLFKSVEQPRKKRSSRGSKSLGGATKSMSVRYEGLDINKPLPVPKLALSKDAAGRSVVDSNPFESPTHSPQRSLAGTNEVQITFTASSSHKASKSTTSSSSSSKQAPGRLQDQPEPMPQAHLQRTLTASAPAASRNTLYTPSVYSEHQAETTAPHSAPASQSRAPTRSPSVPLPRRSSKRQSRPQQVAESAHVRVSSDEARSFSFQFGEEARQDSVASVSSDIKRAAEKPSPLRISIHSARGARDSVGGGIESPPWPPTRFSMGGGTEQP